MGIQTTKYKIQMRVTIALVLLLAFVAAQKPVVVKKWMCCTVSGMSEPQWTDKCAAARRLQAPVEGYCPKKLESPKRILQAIMHPVATVCATFNASRRLQAIVKPTLKCPVNIEGIQCFKNNTNKACVQPKYSYSCNIIGQYKLFE